MSRCVETIEQIGPPFEYPVSIAELREHLQLGDTTEQDSRLEAYRAAALAAIEHQLDGRVLVRQQWRLTLDDLPACGYIVLPKRPVISVDLFRYRDTSNAWQSVSTSNYRVDGKANPPLIRTTLRGSGWPSTYGEWGSVEVEFTAGYAASEFVPVQAIHAMKLLVGHFYENREPVVVGSSSTVAAEIPMTVQYLIDQLKVLRA